MPAKLAASNARVAIGIPRSDRDRLASQNMQNVQSTSLRRRSDNQLERTSRVTNANAPNLNSKLLRVNDKIVYKPDAEF